jgi:ABC-type transport system involved in multi-copper enzyme maturation permease subunit
LPVDNFEKSFIMIWHIAKKDFLLNIISVRFIIGFLLCLLIIPFTIIVNIDDYKNQLRIYQIDRNEAEKNLKETRVYSGLRPVIVKPPEPLGIFCTGISTNMGDKVKTNFGEKPIFPEGEESLRDNPFLNSFLSIDFVSVITILISLLALVFSYDLFTREREDGTLKLNISKGISRSTFMAGKILGVFITLIPILIFCYLLSSLIILLSSDVVFSSGEWMNILILFIISLFFMVTFVMIGTAISSLVRYSSTSIVICLLSWIWFVFLEPAIVNHGVESFVKKKLYENISHALDEIDRDYYTIVWNKYQETIQEEGIQSTFLWYVDGGEDGYFETSGTPIETMEFERRMRTWSESVRIENADRKWAIQKEYLDGLIRQARWQQYLAWLSPSMIFEQVSAGLCRTDLDAFLNFMDDVLTYREILIKHFKNNGWFESLRYITAQPVDQIVTFEEFERISKSNNIPDCWSNKYNPTLDLSDIPMFRYQAAGLPDLINQGLLRIIALLAGCIVLFVLTQWSFNNYDIR